MKLAKGSKHIIDSFEKAAHRQLQTLSLSSKLSIYNEIVSEVAYICNQNFDHRNDFHCVALSDEDWMLWNLYDQNVGDKEISNQVPKFLEVHHVRVKSFSKQKFLKCDCLLYER